MNYFCVLDIGMLLMIVTVIYLTVRKGQSE
jgi:hypothetical protein